MGYARDNIERLSAYVPGEQPGAGEVVKLNTNENPYPPSPGVLEAVAGVSGEQLRRYPPPAAPGFRQQAAALHGLEPENVIATNGADELLRLAVTAFCGVGEGGVGVTEPTYSLYEVLASIHDTPVTAVGLNEDWSLPEHAAQRWGEAGCRLVMVVNPHAPSGRLEPVEQLEAIADHFRGGRGVVVVDEAYVDFARRDAVELVRRCDNVLIARTLSKGYSLAGLRFGYGLADASLIAVLDKVRDSYNTDAVSQAAATAALADADAARARCRQVVDERARLAEGLSGLGYHVAPSEANFLLVTVPGAERVHESLKAKSIYVRYFKRERLLDKLRVTVGTPEQNDALLGALREMNGT